jgi:hypothetical protein
MLPASHQPVHAIDIALDTVLSKRHPLCGGVSESVGNVGAALRHSLEVMEATLHCVLPVTARKSKKMRELV